MLNLIKIHKYVLKILSRNETQTSIKGHNSVANLRKLSVTIPSQININAYAKFGQNISIYSQDIEQKQNSDVNEGP